MYAQCIQICSVVLVLFASLLPIMLLLADDLLDASPAELSWRRGDSDLLLCCSWPPIALCCSLPDRVVTEKLYAGSLEILEMMAGCDFVTILVSRIHLWLHYLCLPPNECFVQMNTSHSAHCSRIPAPCHLLRWDAENWWHAAVLHTISAVAEKLGMLTSHQVCCPQLSTSHHARH